VILYYFLFKTYLIFFFFTLILSLFGGIFVYFFQKWSKKNWNLTILEYCFISYAIGLLIYIQLAYILNLYKSFNFTTALLPILLISLIFLLYLYKTKKIHDNLTRIKNHLNSNHKDVIIHILILSIIFIFQFLFFWPKVSETLALSAFNDTHRWITQVLFLQKYGYVNFAKQSIIYPWGFNFFCAGNLLLSPDLITTYFFIKLAGFPFLNFYTLVFFSISKRFLKRPSLIFFCLISTFLDLNFLLRSILFLSSTISLLLILISLIILLTETPNYLLAFTISGSFLINPIYALFFIMALILFYIFKIISANNNKNLIFKEIVIIFSLFFVFIIIYFISCVFFYNLNLNTLIEEVFWIFQKDSLNNVNNLKKFSPNLKFLLFLFNLFSSLLMNNTFFNIIEVIFYFFSIIILYGFSILSFFFRDKKRSEIYKNFILFQKIGLILTIIFIFTPFFFEKNLFTDQFYVRSTETFFPCIILLAGFFLEWILNISNKSENFPLNLQK